MNRVPFLFIVVVLTLSAGAGFCRGWLMSLQHVVSSEWTVLASYLVVIPLTQLLSLCAGAIAGYYLGARWWRLMFLVGIPAYVLFQGASSGKLVLDAPTAVAHGLGYALVNLVALLAGSYVAREMKPTDHSLNPDAPDGPRD